MQETQETKIWSLGQADALEWEMATHSTILVWRIPWTEEPGGLQFMGSQESDTTEHSHYASPPAVCEGSCFSAWSPALGGL